MSPLEIRLAAVLSDIEDENQVEDGLSNGELNHREGAMHAVIRIREELGLDLELGVIRPGQSGGAS